MLIFNDAGKALMQARTDVPLSFLRKRKHTGIAASLF